ncbi:MAG: site-specific integrase [Acidobacteriota bacterium]|nr:site-specific integrase [Acidobacteriota bacterium]
MANKTENIKLNEEKQRRARSREGGYKWMKGNLYARLQYPDESGKQKEKLRRVHSGKISDVWTEVRKMRDELNHHGEEVLNSDKLIFNDLADQYEKVELVEAIYQNGAKIMGKRSIAPVRSAIKPLREHFGRKQIRLIKASDLKIYKNKRLNTPVEIEVNERYEIFNERTKRKKKALKKVVRKHPRKIATINRELARLRVMLNFAIDNDWLIKNPFSKAKGVISTSAEVERDRVLTPNEEDRLLSYCVDERAHIKPIIVCALDTAMRKGEMLKMIWRDVNFDTGEIYIPKTNAKTEDERTVGMTTRLKNELERLWNISPQDLDGSVFGIKTNITKAFNTACQKAKIDKFRLHDCRHTATTRMIASGSEHTEVMKITGHTQLKTFLRYLSITPETAKKCATRLDNYLVQIASQNVESNLIN